jgi:hypothetical protein
MSNLEESDIYTDINEAKIEIHKRWGNAALKKQVQDYLGEIPETFINGPKAVLFRSIITPDHELSRFIELSKQVDLSPLGVELTDDTFTTSNFDKLALLQLPIFEKRNKKDEAIVHHTTIADLNGSDGKNFKNINTYDGEPIIDFHHRLLVENLIEKLELIDISAWLRERGLHAKEYYKYFFALLICHGVQCESYVTNDSESEFENTVVLPAFREIESLFGIKPLIVQLLPDTQDRYWWAYPSDVILNHVNKT